MDYLSLRPPKVYLSLDPDLIPVGFKIEGPDHPCVVLTPRPTLEIMHAIQDLSERQDVPENRLAMERTRLTLALCIQRLTGDWAYVLNSRYSGLPDWPDLEAPEDLEARERIVKRFVAPDLSRLAEEIAKITTLTEAEEKK